MKKHIKKHEITVQNTVKIHCNYDTVLMRYLCKIQDEICWNFGIIKQANSKYAVGILIYFWILKYK